MIILNCPKSDNDEVQVIAKYTWFLTSPVRLVTNPTRTL